MKFILSLFVLQELFGLISSSSVSVTGFCGDPGKPNKSQFTPTQTIYNEGEIITYTCDEYISLKQLRKCVNGKWRGEQAICGESFRDNDLKWAEIYSKTDGSLIEEYNTSVLLEWNKFGNSFIVERYPQPLRASGSKSYRFKLQMRYKDIFQLVRISLSVVNHTIDDSIRRSNFNITKVTTSPYRECRFNKQSSVSGWLHNSTRFDFWFSCESKDDKSFEREIKDKSNLVTIETESNNELDLDLATFILAKPYLSNGQVREPICGLPETPVGLENHVINHNTKYSFECSQGFKMIGSVPQLGDTYDLFCGTDMKWMGKLPQCLPEKTCKKFEITEKHLSEVFLYEKVYYHNDSQWFAIEGTKAHFRCKEETQLFVGKEYRICKDGEWSDSSPNCLNTGLDKPSKEIDSKLLTHSVIIIVIIILVFSLIAILVYCVIRMKRMRSKKKNLSMKQMSNIYDEYDFGIEGKAMEETYESVAIDDDRYADNRLQRNITPLYTPMISGAYKYNYNDRNVYDDSGNDYGYETNRQNLSPIDLEESYVVMKSK